MEQHTPTTNELALLLFTDERSGDADAEELPNAVQRTFEKLGLHLSQRLGSGGYHALLKRAVTLAAADFPWLAAVQVTEGGDLTGFGPASEAWGAAEAAEGGMAVLARLIGLLDAFIGRTLCLRVLHTVWPDSVGIGPEDSQEDGNG
jgi:hypothetical protein